MSIYPRIDPAAMRYTERLRAERDDARAVARQLHAALVAAKKEIARMGAAHAAETERLRAEIASLTGQPRGVEWDVRVRVDAAALTDAEAAGWAVYQMTLHPHAPLVSVALRRDRTPNPPTKARTKTGAHAIVEMTPETVTETADDPAALAARAFDIESRMPKRQREMLTAIAAGRPVPARDAGARKALKDGGLITVGARAGWDADTMKATALGMAVAGAVVARLGKKGAA